MNGENLKQQRGDEKIENSMNYAKKKFKFYKNVPQPFMHILKQGVSF